MHHNTDEDELAAKKADLLVRCRIQVTKRNNQHGWQLDSTKLEDMATVVLTYVSAKDDDTMIGDIVQYYYSEQPFVDAMLNQGQPHHEQAWYKWCGHAQRLLRARGLVSVRDRAVEDNDLVQEAMEVLVRAIPTYRYRSLFRVWAAQVIINHTYNLIKRSKTDKHRADTITLDTDEHENMKADPVLVEDQVLGQLFMRHAAQALGHDQRHRRLWRVMLLHACDDQTFRMISTTLGVSVARAKRLYDQAQAHLHAHPEVRAWLDEQTLHNLKQDNSISGVQPDES